MKLYDIPYTIHHIPEKCQILPDLLPPEKKYIIIHNTGNPNPQCDAGWHDEYIHRQATEKDFRQASWHLTVDDKEIFEHVPLYEAAWHASDTSYGRGNYTGIGIEMCVNGFPGVYEGKEFEKWLETFRKTMYNTAVLTRWLMNMFHIPFENILQHYDCAPDRKNCPEQMRRDIPAGCFSRENGTLYNEFLQLVKTLELPEQNL